MPVKNMSKYTEDIYVSKTSLINYKNAIVSFWMDYIESCNKKFRNSINEANSSFTKKLHGWDYLCSNSLQILSIKASYIKSFLFAGILRVYSNPNKLFNSKRAPEGEKVAFYNFQSVWLKVRRYWFDKSIKDVYLKNFESLKQAPPPTF